MQKQEHEPLKIEVENDISLGDIVTLKSGGPLMTVTKDEGVNVDVTYYVGHEVKSYKIPRSSLAKVK